MTWSREYTTYCKMAAIAIIDFQETALTQLNNDRSQWNLKHRLLTAFLTKELQIWVEQNAQWFVWLTYKVSEPYTTKTIEPFSCNGGLQLPDGDRFYNVLHQFKVADDHIISHYFLFVMMQGTEVSWMDNILFSASFWLFCGGRRIAPPV
jgi:hypothetical protein